MGARKWMTALVWLGLAAASLPATAQVDPAAEISVDIDALLRSGALHTSVTDGVWTVTPRTGSQLLVLPVTVDLAKVQGVLELEPTTVRIRGGRFIAWRVPDPAVAQPMGQPAPMGPAGQPEDASPPRLTRNVTLTPDGVIAWSIDRRPAGGEIHSSNNLYALRLNAQLLRERTGAPPRPTRQANESTREFQERRQQELDAHRAQADEQRELQRRVQALPSEQRMTLPDLEAPAHFSAVFEVSGTTRQITVSGVQPDDWSIELAQLEALSRLRASGDSLSFARAAQTVLAVAGGAHAFTLRAVALGLNPQVLQRMQVHDPLYALLARMLDATVVEDSVTRQLVAEQLALANPQTPATGQLLSLASADSDAGVQREVMSAADVPLMLHMANTMLPDPDAGRPDAILEKILQRADGQNAAHLVAGVNFEGMSADRLERAVAAVLRHAAADDESPARRVAAGWVDQRLLGANDPTVVRTTLRLLEEAGAGTSMLEPRVQQALDMLLGPPVASDDRRSTVTLAAPIPLSSARHSLFMALQSGDAQTRSLAWQSLRHFGLDGHGAGPFTAPVADAPGEPDVYAALVAAALGWKPTPVEAVQFIVRQPDARQDPRATEALLQLAAEGDGAATNAAARAVIGSGRPISRALLVMRPAQRKAFADAVYAAARQEPSPVTGLLLDPSPANRLGEWFGTQVAEGTIPEASAWASGVGHETALFGMVTHRDPQVGEAAVAALVAAAGGDPTASKPIADRLRNMSASELPAAWAEQRRNIVLDRMKQNAGPYELTLQVYAPPNGDFPADEFTPNRPNLPMQHMGPMPGPMPDPMLGPMPGPLPGGDTMHEAPRGAPTQRFSLGVVNLRIDGNAITFGPQLRVSVPDEAFAIRFDQPSDLQNISRDLAGLPLDSVAPIVLRPEEGNRWRGWAPLQDGRTVELTLQQSR